MLCTVWHTTIYWSFYCDSMAGHACCAGWARPGGRTIASPVSGRPRAVLPPWHHASLAVLGSLAGGTDPTPIIACTAVPSSPCLPPVAVPCGGVPVVPATICCATGLAMCCRPYYPGAMHPEQPGYLPCCCRAGIGTAKSAEDEAGSCCCADCDAGSCCGIGGTGTCIIPTGCAV